MPQVSVTFSICMPAFNAEKWIGRAIASLREQTDPDWELIAVDNASTDRTWKILSDAARADARIHVHRNETNLGQAGNWNVCLQKAQGEILGFLPSDDSYRPETLARVREGLADPEVLLWVHAHESVHGDGRRDVIRSFSGEMKHSLQTLAEILYSRGNLFGEMCCFFLNREAALRIPGGFGPNRLTLDIDFWTRFALFHSGGAWIYSPEILAQAGQHAASDSSRYSSTGKNWVDSFSYFSDFAGERWPFAIRARQILRIARCLLREYPRLPAEGRKVGWLALRSTACQILSTGRL